MKKCSYCGHDNADEASNCRECGREFERPREAPLPQEPTQRESSHSMTSKQLANVLIKVLGLSVCLQGIPGFVSGFLRGLASSLHASEPARGASGSSYFWTYAVGSAVYLAVGIFLILRSGYVAEKLFGNEDR